MRLTPTLTKADCLTHHPHWKKSLGCHMRTLLVTTHSCLRQVSWISILWLKACNTWRAMAGVSCSASSKWVACTLLYCISFPRPLYTTARRLVSGWMSRASKASLTKHRVNGLCGKQGLMVTRLTGTGSKTYWLLTRHIRKIKYVAESARSTLLMMLPSALSSRLGRPINSQVSWQDATIAIRLATRRVPSLSCIPLTISKATLQEVSWSRSKAMVSTAKTSQQVLMECLANWSLNRTINSHVVQGPNQTQAQLNTSLALMAWERSITTPRPKCLWRI